MPGLYILAILVSAGFIALLDARFTLAFWRSPGRAAAAVGTGAAFLLAWDLAGIAAGVFVKGDSPLYLGWDLAPHLPVEEVFFLLFLAYLALVVHAGIARLLARRRIGGRLPDDNEETDA